MEYTKFGELMKIYRIKRHESAKMLADELNVSKAFLSSVERGKKSIPSKWLDIISDHYKLSDSEKDELQKAINDSRTSIKVDLIGIENYKRDLVFKLVNNLNGIDEETANVISVLLNKTNDDVNTND